MAAPIDLRNDFDSVSLRRLAKRTRDATQSRRLLALAEVYDGGGRTDASRIGGVGLQIIRDWVLRFNARGPDGLVDGKSPGAPSKLNADHRRALAEVVEAGPVPAVDGVVRWRRKDLARWLLETFAISLDETTVGRELKALGFAKISARPRHYAQNELAVEAFKKNFPAELAKIRARLPKGVEIELWWQDEARIGQKNKLTHPRGWTYKLDLASPEGQETIVKSGAEILHPKYSTDRRRPHQGVPPMARAGLLSSLYANLEDKTAAEAGGTVGHVLPIPTDGADETVEQLRIDLESLNGKTALVETTAAGWGDGRVSAPRADWQPQRIGANYPNSIPNMVHQSRGAVLAACGVPVELVNPSDGSSMREAWRRFLHGTVAPLAHIIEGEIFKMYGQAATLNFEALFASDIQGRARAFQSMVTAGMDISMAATLSGMLTEEGQ